MKEKLRQMFLQMMWMQVNEPDPRLSFVVLYLETSLFLRELKKIAEREQIELPPLEK